MRINNPVFRSGIAATVIAIVLSAATPAAAQGFLESLFGAFAPKPQPKRQAAPPYVQSPRASGDERTNPFDVRPSKRSSGGGGRYKTMCVRLCDGFYFPISNSVSRRSFYRDAEICQSQCDSETRLFFMSTTAGSIEQARDQSGLNYKALPNAFAYRKKLETSCTCRAKPWSEAERSRHQRYAMIEEGKLDPKAAILAAESQADGGETAVGDGGEALPKEGEAGQISAGSSLVTQAAQGPSPGTAEGSLQGSHSVVLRQPAPVAKKPIAPPAFGLGAMFQAGGGSGPPKLKQIKRKFQWPGDDGN